MTRLLALVALFAMTSFAQADVDLLTCEDQDRDGRFGIVSYSVAPQAASPVVVRSNIGTFKNCQSKLRSTNQCDFAGDVCVCEDQDGDGRFGAVRYGFGTGASTVLRTNVGNYYDCAASLRSYSNSAQAFHACEDRDGDGRFGVVQYRLMPTLGKPIIEQANLGNYYSCADQLKTDRRCAGGTTCLCKDLDGDGRFGIVRFQGRTTGSSVVRANIGTYQQCDAAIRQTRMNAKQQRCKQAHRDNIFTQLVGFIRCQ